MLDNLRIIPNTNSSITIQHDSADISLIVQSEGDSFRINVIAKNETALLTPLICGNGILTIANTSNEHLINNNKVHERFDPITP